MEHNILVLEFVPRQQFGASVTELEMVALQKLPLVCVETLEKLYCKTENQ